MAAAAAEEASTAVWAAAQAVLGTDARVCAFFAGLDLADPVDATRVIWRLKQLRLDPYACPRADFEFLQRCPLYLGFTALGKRARGADLEVVYEDERFVAVLKPWDYHVDLRANDPNPAPTVSQWFRQRYRLPVRLCHQLDYATSGVMLLAKSKASAGAACKLFRERQVHKVYRSVLLGSVDVRKLEVVEPNVYRLRCNVVEDDWRMRVTVEGGVACETYMSVLGRGTLHAPWFDTGCEHAVTHVEFRPVTGRRHQLRVTASYVLQCPILGDMLYGCRVHGTSPPAAAAVHRASYRMYLHALSLSVPLPDRPLLLSSEDPLLDCAAWRS